MKNKFLTLLLLGTSYCNAMQSGEKPAPKVKLDTVANNVYEIKESEQNSDGDINVSLGGLENKKELTVRGDSGHNKSVRINPVAENIEIDQDMPGQVKRDNQTYPRNQQGSADYRPNEQTDFANELRELFGVKKSANTGSDEYSEHEVSISRHLLPALKAVLLSKGFISGDKLNQYFSDRGAFKDNQGQIALKLFEYYSAQRNNFTILFNDIVEEIKKIHHDYKRPENAPRKIQKLQDILEKYAAQYFEPNYEISIYQDITGELLDFITRNSLDSAKQALAEKVLGLKDEQKAKILQALKDGNIEYFKTEQFKNEFDIDYKELLNNIIKDDVVKIQAQARGFLARKKVEARNAAIQQYKDEQAIAQYVESLTDYGAALRNLYGHRKISNGVVYNNGELSRREHFIPALRDFLYNTGIPPQELDTHFANNEISLANSEWVRKALIIAGYNSLGPLNPIKDINTSNFDAKYNEAFAMYQRSNLYIKVYKSFKIHLSKYMREHCRPDYELIEANNSKQHFEILLQPGIVEKIKNNVQTSSFTAKRSGGNYSFSSGGSNNNPSGAGGGSTMSSAYNEGKALVQLIFNNSPTAQQSQYVYRLTDNFNHAKVRFWKHIVEEFRRVQFDTSWGDAVQTWFVPGAENDLKKLAIMLSQHVVEIQERFRMELLVNYKVIARDKLMFDMVYGLLSRSQYGLDISDAQVDSNLDNEIAKYISAHPQS